MRDYNLTLTKEAANIFLNGGKVIGTLGSDHVKTCLVRMSKGAMAEYEGQEWEYVIIQNRRGGDTLHVASYHNNSVRRMKEKFSVYHYETEYYEEQRIERDKQYVKNTLIKNAKKVEPSLEKFDFEVSWWQGEDMKTYFPVIETVFIASYNGDYFNLFMDRDHEKRVGIKIEREELVKLAEEINSMLEVQKINQ